MKLSDFDKSLLTEVSMSPSSLQKWAKSPITDGMLMGFEFEICVPDTKSDNLDVPDYSKNTEIDNIDDIVDFFDEGGYYNADFVRQKLEQAYFKWKDDHYTDYRDILDDEFNNHIRVELKKQGHDATDIDRMINRQHGDGWDEAFDDADSKFRKLWNKSFASNEDKWLSDLNLRTLRDVSDYFSLEWPYYGGSGTSSIDEVAYDLEVGLDVPVIVGYSYHDATRNDTDWIVEPDLSIVPEDDADAGLEFISPPMPLEQAFAKLHDFKDWTNRYGCYTNDSTGFHINISVPNLSYESLDYVKLAIFLGDKHVLEQFGRLSNKHCRSALDIISTRINEPNAAEQVLAHMRQQLNTTTSKLIHSGFTLKTTSIHVHEGYVEFRGAGGNYLELSADTLVNTALRLAMALSIASDETLYKKEYAKKLYKLITSNIPANSSKIAMELFAQYLSGNMDKYVFINKLRWVQASRNVQHSRPIPPPPRHMRPLVSNDDDDESLPKWNVLHVSSGRQGIVYAPSAETAIKQVVQNHRIPAVELSATAISDN